MFQTAVSDLLLLLIDSSRDLNAKNSDGNTVLHILASQAISSRQSTVLSPTDLESLLSRAMREILAKGGHRDARNCRRQTFADILATSDKYKSSELLRGTFPPLQCLSATVVREMAVPYENELGRVLTDFVNLH